jgi:hypothetical protein
MDAALNAGIAAAGNNTSGVVGAYNVTLWGNVSFDYYINNVRRTGIS